MKIVSSGKCSMYFFLLIISLVFSSCIKDPSLLEGQEGGFGFKYYGSGERIGSVGGTILDAQNGDPIGDAKVYVKNYEEETTTYTDPDGHYFIPDIFLGIQVLVIIKPGFIIEEVKVDLFEEEESKDERRRSGRTRTSNKPRWKGGEYPPKQLLMSNLFFHDFSRFSGKSLLKPLAVPNGCL